MRTIRILALMLGTMLILAGLTYLWGQGLESRFRKMAEAGHQNLPPTPVAIDYWNTVMRMPSYWLVVAGIVVAAFWFGRRWAF